MKKYIIPFINPKIASGLLLIFVTFMALVAKNSPVGIVYDEFLNLPIHISIGTLSLHKPLFLWVNDGLMAIFFFLIGLEIKREIIDGELSSVKKASLPVLAALGGIIMPAIIFISINIQNPETIHGWAIPVATDIAFALGILSLLGNRVPNSLKILLLSLAIIDDLAAIIIIAVFYTANLSVLNLLWGLFFLSCAALCNWRGVSNKAPYILLGILAWVCVLKSGVHATLAGVMLALTIPLNVTKNKIKISPLKEMEHALYPWVSFLIMPLFAFTNSGINLSKISLENMMEPLPLGIILGLFLGKQLGVFSTIFITVKLGITQLPSMVKWHHIYGLSLITGIGFTMSLFIGSLAFDDVETLEKIRISVMMASILSGICGYMVLKAIKVKSKRHIS